MLLLWCLEDVGDVVEAGRVARHVRVEARRRSLWMTCGRLDEVAWWEGWWWLLRDLHWRQTWVTAHATTTWVLLWRFGEVAALLVGLLLMRKLMLVLLLLLQEKALLIEEAGWRYALGGATLRQIMASLHHMRIMPWSVGWAVSH